jgi:hypothetical protein
VQAEVRVGIRRLAEASGHCTDLRGCHWMGSGVSAPVRSMPLAKPIASHCFVRAVERGPSVQL